MAKSCSHDNNRTETRRNEDGIYEYRVVCNDCPAVLSDWHS